MFYNVPVKWQDNYFEEFKCSRAKKRGEKRGENRYG